MASNARGAVAFWRGDVVASLAVGCIGVGFAALASFMPLWEDGVPGPGLVPMFLGIGLAGLGALCALNALTGRVREVIPFFDSEAVLAVTLTTIAILAFKPLGSILTAFAFLTAFVWLIGKVSPIHSLVFSAIAALLIWLFFVKALGVGLPTGNILTVLQSGVWTFNAR